MGSSMLSCVAYHPFALLRARLDSLKKQPRRDATSPSGFGGGAGGTAQRS
jgi:hypothetical protein